MGAKAMRIRSLVTHKKTGQIGRVVLITDRGVEVVGDWPGHQFWSTAAIIDGPSEGDKATPKVCSACGGTGVEVEDGDLQPGLTAEARALLDPPPPPSFEINAVRFDPGMEIRGTLVAPDMPEPVPNAGATAADGGGELAEDSKDGEKSR